MPEPLRKCPVCKAVVDPGDQFCGFCGSPVEATSSPPASPGPPSPTRPTVPPGPPRLSTAPAPPAPPSSPLPQSAPTQPAEPPEQPPAPSPSQATPFEGSRPDKDPVVGSETAREPKNGSPVEPPSERKESESVEAPRPGFWIRNRGWGLLLARLGVAALLLYAWNPEMVGTIEDGRGWELVEESLPWVRLPVGMDFPTLYYGIVVTHMIGGLLIGLGLLFRPACLVVALSWGYILFLQVTIEGGYFSLPELSQSAALILVFMGLMFAGPGRLALGGAERKGRRKPASAP